jgi:predicted RNA binding protein YcfA (HicA-like mRNA interferase family)
MMTDSRAIMARMIREGWVIDRIRGSHHILKHPTIPATVVLPHPRKDLPLGTV